MKNEAKPGIKWQRNHIFEIYFAVYENIVKNIIFRSVFIDGAIFYIFRFFFFFIIIFVLYYAKLIIIKKGNVMLHYIWHSFLYFIKWSQ